MPPKIKVSKEMILNASFEIIQKEGHESLNARRIAEHLGCSTQPVLYNFETVDEIREDVYKIADEFHTGYIMPKGERGKNPMLELGVNYVRFGHEESNLFRFLFQTNKFGGMGINVLMNASELSAIIAIVSESVKCSEEEAREFFLTFFVVAHGYASLMANNAMEYNEEQVEMVLTNVFYGMCAAKKGDN